MSEKRRAPSLLVTALFMGACSLPGCATSAPETPEPTSKEIKKDSDGFFEKMDQEQRERAKERVGTTTKPSP
jgi:hypothetical protein